MDVDKCWSWWRFSTMAIHWMANHDGRWWDAIPVPRATLNCGSRWCSSFCCVNLGRALVKVCWILHLATSDVDSRYVCFLLSEDVQAQASNLCVDHEVHECTMKYIGKKHYTLWNVHKYRDSRNNTYPNHTLWYIPLNYHQVPSSRLILPFSRLWVIWN